MYFNQCKMTKLTFPVLLLLNIWVLVIGNHCFYAITDIENKVTKSDTKLGYNTNMISQRISYIEAVLEKLELHSPHGKQITTGNIFIIERNQTIKGRYLGCFKDFEENRMFRGEIKKFRYNSVDKCIETCTRGGFVYAGLSLHFCYCGNAFPNPAIFEKVSETNCDAKCFDNSSQICGDWNNSYNSVYETGVEVYTFDTSGIQVSSIIPPSSPKIQFKVREDDGLRYDDD
uniref:CSON013550 protein n=1 Tax=Culicoides sonorensis TaxID=179676 RepID=A0A336M894_CULSO